MAKKWGSKGQDHAQQSLRNPSSTASNTHSKSGRTNSKGGNANSKGDRNNRGALHPGGNCHPTQR